MAGDMTTAVLIAIAFVGGCALTAAIRVRRDKLRKWGILRHRTAHDRVRAAREHHDIDKTLDRIWKEWHDAQTIRRRP